MPDQVNWPTDPANQASIDRDQKLGILLLHGLGGVPADILFLEQHLKSMGCIVETPMLAGHGLSDKELLATEWHEWVADLERSLDALCQRCDGVIIGGVSIGAVLAPVLAVDHPQVWGIVSMSPTMRFDGRDADKRLQFLLPLVDIFPGLGEKYFESEAFKVYARSLRQLQHLVRHLESQAVRVKCSALIMHGQEDSLTSGWNAQQLWSWLGSADKEIYWLRGDDHFITMNLQRQEVVRKFAEFATKISWLNSNPKRPQSTEIGVLSFLTNRRAIS